jgi:hypothetical protein
LELGVRFDLFIVKEQKYPELSSYQFASNTPLQAIDLDGLEALVTTFSRPANGTTQAQDNLSNRVYVKPGSYKPVVSITGSDALGVYAYKGTRAEAYLQSRNGEAVQRGLSAIANGGLATSIQAYRGASLDELEKTSAVEGAILFALGTRFNSKLSPTTNRSATQNTELYKTGFSNFKNLDELQGLFKGRDLGNTTDDLIKSGWTKVEGDWGSKTIIQKQIGNERFYANWESRNMEHSTNKLPTNYWKLTKGKINATGDNVKRVSDAPNFKKSGK